MDTQNPPNPLQPSGTEQGAGSSADQGGQQRQQPQQSPRTAQPVQGPGARQLLPSNAPGYPAQGAPLGQTPMPGQAPTQMQALRIAPQQPQSPQSPQFPQFPQQGFRYQPQQPAATPPAPADMSPVDGGATTPRANRQKRDQAAVSPAPTLPPTATAGATPEPEGSPPLSRFFWPTHAHPAQLDRWQQDGYSFAVPVADPENPGSVRWGLGLSGLAVVSAVLLVALSVSTYTGSMADFPPSAQTLGIVFGIIGFILALGGMFINGKTMWAMQHHMIRRASAQQARDAQRQRDIQRQAGQEVRTDARQPATPPIPLLNDEETLVMEPEPEPEPMVFEQRAPAQFEDRDPDAALGDRYPDTATVALERDGWAISGVSLRGLSHKHDAKFREDAIAGDISNGWQIGVVCDGGGSYDLARVGANVAAEAALRGASAATNKYKRVSQRDAETALRAILLAALQGAHDALQAEEKRRGVSWQEMRTTLLVVVQRHLGKGIHALGGAQVGDGAIVARFYNQDAINEHMLRLTTPDIGPTGNETIFFQDVPPEQWEDRIKTYIKEGPGCYCLAMTDGVSDDFTPIEQHMPLLEEPLFRDVLKGQPPARVTGALEQLLSYERPGSFDDRSLVCIYHLGERPWK